MRRNSLAVSFSSPAAGTGSEETTASFGMTASVARSKQTLGIQNEPHPAVSENDPASNAGDVAHPFTQAFDHYLLLANQLVHHQAEQFGSALGHDQQAIPGVLVAGLDMKALVQPDHWNQRATHHGHLLAAMDGGNGFLSRLQHLAHREDRDNVAL